MSDDILEDEPVVIKVEGIPVGTANVLKYSDGEIYLGRMKINPTPKNLELILDLIQNDHTATEGEKLMGEQNQPEDYVPPTTPPPSVSNGGIGTAKKINPTEVDIRKFAVNKAIDAIGEADRVTNIEEAIIRVASRIEKFVRNGAEQETK